jgi:phosphate:Na+ symporter
MIGALTTAVVQSSSATTVATVGFVGAGLLTFPQALGIVLGANVGTTVTGWLVALLGFKLELGTAALPIVFVGVLIRLFAGGRASSAGFAVAGFGLIFVGISLLQQGMGGFVGIITPESFPGDTWTGRLLLVAFGIAFTLVTQSSSAGVAMALAAVNASAMTVQQAAAAVIGMDIGTTVTAVLATVGGSVHARRTGYAHAMYNLFAGTAAFLILVPFMRAFEHFAPRLLASEPELVLVGFHTFFNLLGVSIALPFATKFGGLLIRLVPLKLVPFAHSLDRSLLDAPAAALDALGTTLSDLTATTFEMILQLLSVTGTRGVEARVSQVRQALSETRDYVECIRSSPDEGWTSRRHLSAMHVIDHLDRLADRCAEAERWETLKEDPQLAMITRGLARSTGARRANRRRGRPRGSVASASASGSRVSRTRPRTGCGGGSRRSRRHRPPRCRARRKTRRVPCLANRVPPEPLPRARRAFRGAGGHGRSAARRSGTTGTELKRRLARQHDRHRHGSDKRSVHSGLSRPWTR